MIAKVEAFNTGWFGITLEVTRSDIQRLIARLNELQDGAIGHFHIRNDDFSADVGIADIAISLCDEGSPDGMSVE